MRIREHSIGIVSQFDAISPEVERAQRMAELKNIAEYRARRLQAYRDWANPIKRAELQAKHQQELKQAREIWEAQLKEDHRRLQMHEPKTTYAETISMRVLTKCPGKSKPWYQRLLDWFKR